MRVETPSRRRLLAAGASLAGVLLAGCSSDDESADDDGQDSGGTDTGDDSGDGGTGDSSDTGDDSGDSGTDDSGNTGDGTGDGGTDDSNDDSADGDGELDLREANVVSVTYEADGDGYRFTVGLHHDDDGEGGYANWWQVERLDGTRLGRRELRHAHSRQPFERSETLTVPSAVSCVVVRGHDQTHGYGGQAMLVDLDSGATQAVDQGQEPQSFAESDCP